ncbi:protocatechuate 3,4-dioxygenase subunit alpha [Agromyces tardus]|uniref:Protocatechuate 3,4-dioxygenase subunit alpha n=1 Tax=Agromyces tardus TaxID=2583849 RepID=A0A3M8AHU8_9MICO|nr:protocatechuate 3,4-dioxygenase subunit alpha [Agromyces tardus]RNB50659.1 protocatechuate 3,4-dioxygenase subunit alpha [Agromyces tardus]
MPETPFLQTPSQTVGPFFGFALPYAGGPEVAPPWHPSAIRFHGTVIDGAGVGVPDAFVEIWGADAAGRVIAERGSFARDGHTVTGFGRAAADRDGHYSFTTIKPGPTRADAAPYLLVTVFARGLMHHLFTRAYFGDEPERNAGDRLLGDIDPARRATLIAQADGDASYRFDIRLQGEGETVFLDFDRIDDPDRTDPDRTDSERDG